MNRERAKELLPIIEAFANGEDIQFRLIELHPDLEDEWLDLPKNKAVCVTFPADDYQYRVKPKAREWFIGDPDDNEFVKVYKGGSGESLHGYIKVREVLE